MNKKSTPASPETNQTDLLRSKLSATPVPGWKEGWEQLLPALEELPVQPPRTTGIWTKGLLSAAATLAVLVLWLIWSHPPAESDATGRPAGMAVRLPAEPVTKASLQPAQRDASHAVIPMAVFTPLKKPADIPSSLADEKAVKPEGSSGIPAAGMQAMLPVLPAVPPVVLTRDSGQEYPVAALAGRDKTIPPALPEQVSPASLAASSKNRQSSGIHIIVALNANSGSGFGHAAYNFNPVLKGTPVDIYPSVYVNKPLGPKFSLQAGLAVCSPVEVQKEGLDRSVSNPVRAMAANVPQSDDSVNLSRLYYMDIPLTVQYRLSSRFSVGSGFQLSVLEKVIGEKQRLDYDAYGRVAAAMPQEPQPENLTHAKAISGAVKPVDLRWVIGLSYRPGKRWNIFLQYQRGFTEISRNHAFLNNPVSRSDILQAGVGFRVK